MCVCSYSQQETVNFIQRPGWKMQGIALDRAVSISLVDRCEEITLKSCSCNQSLRDPLVYRLLRRFFFFCQVSYHRVSGTWNPRSPKTLTHTSRLDSSLVCSCRIKGKRLDKALSLMEKCVLHRPWWKVSFENCRKADYFFSRKSADIFLWNL